MKNFGIKLIQIVIGFGAGFLVFSAATPAFA